MPLAGTLHDLSLSSLIQIFCLERKTTRLLVRRPQEVGLIYFAKGEVWHASAGQLTGVDAVTHILSWQFGEFHTIGNEEEAPARTIEQRWDQLLLEGMKWLDERQAPLRHSEVVPLLSRSQRKYEEALEEKLLSFLSQLEQVSCHLHEARVRHNPRAVLGTLAEVTNQTITMFGDTLEQTSLSESARQAARRSLASHFSGLPLSLNRLAIDTPQLFREFQAAGPVQPDAFIRFHTQLTKIVEHSSFAMIAACFQASDIKAELAETYSIFLTDLKQALQ